MPIWGAVFLGIGADAILQVIFVISKMLIEEHKKNKEFSCFQMVQQLTTYSYNYARGIKNAEISAFFY